MPSITIPITSRDTTDYSYYMESSSYKLSNVYGKTSANGTAYGGISLTQGSDSESYVYFIFDTSQIPANATIISVTGSMKIYGSTTSQSRTQTRQIQLFSGTTAKGTAAEFTMSGSAATFNITDGGSWTRDELNDCRIRAYAVRNTSGTTSNTYIYFMGGDVTIEYEDKPTVYHTVSVQLGEGLTIDKELETSVGEGTSYELNITPDNGISINSATDNGVDIKSLLLEKSVNNSGTVTSNPTAYTTTGTISGTKYQTAIGNGSSNTASGNDYSSGGSSSTATIYYSFDFSSIPTNATISSVNVVVGGHLESTSNSSEKADLQLYSGNTAKGSKSSFTTTSKQLVTINAGTWTRAELQDAKLAFTIGYYGGLVNGVDFEVSYTVPGSDKYYSYIIASVDADHVILVNMASDPDTGLRIKTGTEYKTVKKIYKKNSNGIYTEIDASAINRNGRYRFTN